MVIKIEWSVNRFTSNRFLARNFAFSTIVLWWFPYKLIQLSQLVSGWSISREYVSATTHINVIWNSNSQFSQCPPGRHRSPIYKPTLKGRERSQLLHAYYHCKPPRNPRTHQKILTVVIHFAPAVLLDRDFDCCWAGSIFCCYCYCWCCVVCFFLCCCFNYL